MCDGCNTEIYLYNQYNRNLRGRWTNERTDITNQTHKKDEVSNLLLNIKEIGLKIKKDWI